MKYSDLVSFEPIESVMREVMLHDRSFNEIAMDRYGFRTRAWIKIDEPVLRNGKPVLVQGKPLLQAVHHEDIAPRCGRDREKIGHEFNRGVRLLTTAAARLAGGDIDELWCIPAKMTPPSSTAPRLRPPACSKCGDPRSSFAMLSMHCSRRTATSWCMPPLRQPRTRWWRRTTAGYIASTQRNWRQDHLSVNDRRLCSPEMR